MIKILYVSNLCSENVLQLIFNHSNKKPSQAAQKFHRLLTQGFGMHGENCSIETMSSLPLVPGNTKNKIWIPRSETIDNVKFNYVPTLNLNKVKNIGVFLSAFFKILYWCLSNAKRERFIVSDILNVTVATAAFFAAKLTATKNIAIVTDVPGMMALELGKKGKKNSAYKKYQYKFLTNYDAYILLTEQMTHIINPKNKPKIIMEGLVDVKMGETENILKNKYKERVLIYAGGLHEKYGIRTLIEAFIKLKDLDLRLHFYGTGDMEEAINKYSEVDSRIKYFGVVPNKIVVENQLKATLLLNPRPTKEEFTKYSFPSKNMEYMVSGTPVVTTKLSGMPKEYYDYVYLFEEENAAGIYRSLDKILLKSKKELQEFGAKSKTFVLMHKNNSIQAGRVICLYKKL